jgi:hypothetical protein
MIFSMEAVVEPTLAETQNLDELGLIWDDENNRLLDPETGEVFSMAPVCDHATANAAMHKVMTTSAALDALGAAKKRIEAKIKSCKRRKEWLVAFYEPSFKEYLKKIDKTKLPLDYGEVGLFTGRPSFNVIDEAAAIKWAQKNHPGAVSTVYELKVSLLPKGIKLPEGVLAIKPADKKFDMRTRKDKDEDSE